MSEERKPIQYLESIQALDPTIHAPARLMILAILAAIDAADFTFVLNQAGLTRGNLATHMKRLEEAGYVHVQKEFVERIPRTLYSLTREGHNAIQTYRENMRQVIEELLK